MSDFSDLQTLMVDVRPDGVAVVTLNRPPVNAVNRRMMLELTQVFNDLGDRRDVGSIVLTGSGTKAFSAGIDLAETGTGPDLSEAPIRATLDAGWEWRTTQQVVHQCSVPVVAAIEGVSIGAGFGLMGVCDVIIAAESARFALTEINVGLLGGSSKAIRMLGPYKARMMLFGGQFVPAAEFYRLGAVEEVVPDGTACDRAIEIAALFASKSPLALRLAKESVLRIEADQMAQQYRTEQDYTARLRTFEDSAEAMQAFMEKREPVWRWK